MVGRRMFLTSHQKNYYSSVIHLRPLGTRWLVQCIRCVQSPRCRLALRQDPYAVVRCVCHTCAQLFPRPKQLPVWLMVR